MALSISERNIILWVIDYLEKGGAGNGKVDQKTSDELAKVFRSVCGHICGCPGSFQEDLRDCLGCTLLDIILCLADDVALPPAQREVVQWVHDYLKNTSGPSGVHFDTKASDELAKVFRNAPGFACGCPGSFQDGLRDSPISTLLKVILLVDTAAALGVSITALASAGSSDSLFNLATSGGFLAVGDKVFSNFEYLASGLSGFDATQIRVTASFVGGIYYLTFAGNMALLSAGPAIADLLLKYTVTATVGLIFLLDQSYTGSAQPDSGTAISIDETAERGGVIYGNSHLEKTDLSDPFAEIGDDLNINPPQFMLNVTKDMAFGISNVSGGLISISQVLQSFHQT